MIKVAMNAKAKLGWVAALLLLMPFAATPAAAGQSHATLSVSAIVTPSCRIDRQPATAHNAEIACSTGTSFSSATVNRADERPLHEAALILGAPDRSRTGIAFAGPVQPANAADASAAADAAPRYLTITY
jgi:hypothetical protein